MFSRGQVGPRIIPIESERDWRSRGFAFKLSWESDARLPLLCSTKQNPVLGFAQGAVMGPSLDLGPTPSATWIQDVYTMTDLF